jgi:small subunit ribosomal protein S3
MGQKVHPYGFRIGYNRTWHSRWYAEKDYLKFLHDDLKLREELKRDLSNAAVSEVEIERGKS